MEIFSKYSILKKENLFLGQPLYWGDNDRGYFMFTFIMNVVTLNQFDLYVFVNCGLDPLQEDYPVPTRSVLVDDTVQG